MNPTPPTALEVLKAHGRAVDRYLHSALSRLTGAPSRLVEAMDYSLTAGGKRLRPTLLLEAERACAPKTAALPSRSALAAAGAIELIHTFSLVHDDLPAMDDDDLRRGQPTNHKVFGEAVAILAGDAMTAMAFELIATDAEPSIAPALVTELARATGPGGMIGGQVLDMAAEKQQLSLDQLKNVHRMKTGALIVAAGAMGVICAHAGSSRPPPEHRAAICAYCEHLGLAFQIVDDVLDETATPEQLGKATKKDATRGKNTYPALLGLEGARREAANRVDLAIAALAGFGPPADGLRAIARFVGERNS